MSQNQSFNMPTVLIYGRTKAGKTVSVLRAFEDKAYWICTERGALVPAIDKKLNPSGKVPPNKECIGLDRPWEEIQGALEEGLALSRQGKIAAIVIDTLSSFGDREYARIIQKDHVTEQYGKAARVLAGRVKDVVWKVMQSGLIFVCICHEREPTNIEGKITPGGPKLAGKLVEDVPSLFSMVLRCGVDIDIEGNKSRVFRCDPMSRDYITGDRYGVVDGTYPMDLRAILKEAVTKAKAC